MQRVTKSLGFDEHDVLASTNVAKEDIFLIKHNNHFLLRVDRGSLNKLLLGHTLIVVLKRQ